MYETELDEETLNAMLGLSSIPEERDELKKQQHMAEMLGRQALDYNPYLGKGRGTKANVGGALGALAQGMQGYGFGKMSREASTADAGLRKRERMARETWFRNRFGQKQPGMGSAQPMAYFDAGQPEVQVLPPDDYWLR